MGWQFQNSLAKTPLAFAKFDNEYVDNLLKMVLDHMSNDGIIKLKGKKAIIPKYIYDTDQNE